MARNDILSGRLTGTIAWPPGKIKFNISETWTLHILLITQKSQNTGYINRNEWAFPDCAPQIIKSCSQNPEKFLPKTPKNPRKFLKIKRVAALKLGVSTTCLRDCTIFSHSTSLTWCFTFPLLSLITREN